jgi:hypothetical protein
MIVVVTRPVPAIHDLNIVGIDLLIDPHIKTKHKFGTDRSPFLTVM